MSWGRTALQQVVPPVLPNPIGARSHHSAAGGCPESEPRGRRAAAPAPSTAFTAWSCASRAADERQAEADARPVSPSLAGKCSGMLLAGRELRFVNTGLCRLPTETRSRDSLPASTETGLGRRLPWQTGRADTNPLRRKLFLAALSVCVSSSK